MKKLILKAPEVRLKKNASFSISMAFVVIHIGAIINNVIAKIIAMRDDRRSANLFFGLSFSLGIAISADHCNVSIPIFIDS